MKRSFVKLSRDVRGNYQRELGHKPDGQGGYKPQRFYLGKDHAEAAIRVLRLERVWESVVKR